MIQYSYEDDGYSIEEYGEDQDDDDDSDEVENPGKQKGKHD